MTMAEPVNWRLLHPRPLRWGVPLTTDTKFKGNYISKEKNNEKTNL